MILSGLLASAHGAVPVLTPDSTDRDDAPSEEICALYYSDGDPTGGHRSQRATFFADHDATTFELDGADASRICVIQQSDQLRLPGITGCVVWNGAVVLAKSLESWNALGILTIAGHLVLELGAGTGMLAIAAAMLGARVIATEQEDRLKLLRRNIENHSEEGPDHWRTGDPWRIGRRGGSVDLLELDWFRPQDAPEADLVLATDVVYTEEVTAALVRCLAFYTAPAILAVELRTEEVHYGFIEELAAAWFTVHRLPPTLHAEDFQTKRVVIYTLMRGTVDASAVSRSCEQAADEI